MAPQHPLNFARAEDFLKTNCCLRISVLNKQVIIKTLIQTSHLSKEREQRKEALYPPFSS